MKFNKLDGAIESTGKVLGLNLKYFFKNGSWVTFRFLVMALSGWILSLFFARISNKEVLGQYQLILSYLSMFLIVSLPGLNTAALESVVKGREGAIIKTVKLSFLCSLIGLPIFIGWGMYDIFYRNEILLGKTLILVGFLVPFYYTFNTWTAYYDGKAQFSKVSMRMVLTNIVLTSLLLMGLLLKLNVFGLVAIYLLVNIVFFIIFYIEVYKKINNKIDDYLDIKFGVKTSIQKLVLGLSGNVPPIIIAHLFGVESVAIYYIANYLITATSAFMGTLASIYIPTLFKNFKLKHVNIILLNIFAGVVFWVLFLIFLKLFFVILYGTEYNKSLELAYQISYLMILVPFKNYLITFFMTQKKNWFLIATVGIANLIAMAFLLIANGRRDNITNIAYYIYIIELMTAIPMISRYYFIAFLNRNKIN